MLGETEVPIGGGILEHSSGSSTLSLLLQNLTDVKANDISVVLLNQEEEVPNVVRMDIVTGTDDVEFFNVRRTVLIRVS